MIRQDGWTGRLEQLLVTKTHTKNARKLASVHGPETWEITLKTSDQGTSSFYPSSIAWQHGPMAPKRYAGTAARQATCVTVC